MSNNLKEGTVTDLGWDFAALLATVCSRWPKVFVLNFLTRLNVKPDLQAPLCQEYPCDAAGMGLTFVSVDEHLPVHRLKLWCYNGVHLSDDFGMPVLVQLLHAAVLHQLAPPAPKPEVPCHISSRPRVSPALVVTDPVRMLVYGPAPTWTLVGQEVEAATPVIEPTLHTDIPSNSVWFSDTVLDRQEVLPAQICRGKGAKPRPNP